MEKIIITWEETLHSGKFISQKAVNYQDKNWDNKSWEFASRENEWAVATLVEHTDNNTFVFIEQYRMPVQKRVLELVAWICDVENATKYEIVAQEVREEIWYSVDSMEYILSTPNSAWLTDELTHLYNTKISGKASSQQLSASEEIDVIEIKKHEVFNFLKQKELSGVYISKGIYASLALYLYNQAPLAIESLLAK